MADSPDRRATAASTDSVAGSPPTLAGRPPGELPTPGAAAEDRVAVSNTDLRYPIGLFRHDGPVLPRHTARWIDAIEALPGQMRAAVEGLDDEQLDTAYRPGGWTLRQVAHHVPDSHLNSYVRFKWALTEDEPTIKAYDEKGWAALADSEAPVEVSLVFLEALHARWVILLRSLDREQLGRAFHHPDWGVVSLAEALGMYAWHGRHHVAHITGTVERKGWRG